MNKYRHTMPVTTLSLNYVVDSDDYSNNMIQFGLSPRDEARQVAERAHMHNLSNVIVITSAKPWGKQVTQVFEP